MQLSEHFSLDEFTRSSTAMRLGLDNTPGIVQLANLRRLAVAMEQVRQILGGRFVHVDSAYRSVAVNKAVGGQEDSAHVEGLACDFVCPEFGTPEQIALAIQKAGTVIFDQLILEYGWVHLGLAQQGMPPRLMTLTKRSASSPYEPGIVTEVAA
jgi:hypothetical protein